MCVILILIPACTTIVTYDRHQWVEHIYLFKQNATEQSKQIPKKVAVFCVVISKNSGIKSCGVSENWNPILINNETFLVGSSFEKKPDYLLDGNIAHSFNYSETFKAHLMSGSCGFDLSISFSLHAPSINNY